MIQTHTDSAISAERLERLFKIGAQYGYSKSRRHPSVQKFIFGTKENLEIIDLEKTNQLLESAKAYAKKLGEEGKTLLFVGGKHEAQRVVETVATRVGAPYVLGRWIGGTLTNFAEVKKRIERLDDLRTKKEKGELSKYTKKERLMIDREIAKLEEKFGGLVGMEGLPQVMFVVDPKFEHIAVKEAKQTGMKLIALANSDCNISDIDFPIVANDASRTSITFFVEEIGAAYLEGLKGAKTKDQKSDTPAPKSE